MAYIIHVPIRSHAVPLVCDTGNYSLVPLGIPEIHIRDPVEQMYLDLWLLLLQLL